jgi:hypothetical protein
MSHDGLGVNEGLLALGHGEEESSFQAVMELSVSRWFSSAFFVTDSLVDEIHCDTCVAARGTPESDLVWGRVWRPTRISWTKKSRQLQETGNMTRSN